MPTLDRDGEVFLLRLDETENRFSPEWLATVRGHLATVAGADGPRALVTAGAGKFFSNGLDLDWVSTHGERFPAYLADVHALLAELLSMPVPTVAAVQGHAFAAGAMLALAHDFRVMRADRGYLCLPEVDIGLPFTPGMARLISARATPQTAVEAMTTGRRYGGTDALAAGLVDRVAAEDAVVADAVAQARPLAGKAGPVLGQIKAKLWAGPLAALCDNGHSQG